MPAIDFSSFESNFRNLVYDTAEVISVLIIGLCMLSPITITPIYISVFRSNRERDKATPIYPITYYFYKMVYAFYLSIILMLIYFLVPVTVVLYISMIFAAVTMNLVHVHHILLSLLAIQRFMLYFFPNSEKFVSFGIKTTRKIIYFIHFLCFLPFPASLFIVPFIDVVFGIVYDFGDVFRQLIRKYTNCLNCILFLSATFYIPLYISIYRLRHLPSIEKQKPHKYIIYQTIILFCVKIMEAISISVETEIETAKGQLDQILLPSVQDMFITPLLVQIPYLFCNRRNVMAMRKRLSFKYLWSGIRHRNNRVGGIDNQIAIAYIQSTHA